MENLDLELIDNLVFGVINRCETIRKRSKSLCHSEFASDNPVKLAKLIDKICSELIDHIVILRNRYGKDPPKIILDIRLIDDFVQELGAHLRYVDGAVTTKLPWSLPRPLEKLTEEFLPQTTLMLRPQWKYNYSINAIDLGEYYKYQLQNILSENKIKKVFSDFPAGFHIISFPSIEKTNVVLHCDLGHEIGHLIVKKFMDFEYKKSAYLIELRGKISKRVKKEPDLLPLEEGAEITRQLKIAVDIRRRGLEEILSDIFAMRLLGPAALFALFEIAIGDKLDLAPKPSSYYPPWRTRLRHSLGTLEEAKLLPTFDKLPVEDPTKNVAQRIKVIENIVNDKSDQKAIKEDWLTKLAYDSVDEAIPHFREFLRENYNNKFITHCDLYEQVYDLLDRLRKRITPNATNSFPNEEPAKFQSILNAAWFYRISDLTDLFPDNKLNKHYEEDFRTLNLLTLKAIEFSYIQELYDRGK